MEEGAVAGGKGKNQVSALSRIIGRRDVTVPKCFHKSQIESNGEKVLKKQRHALLKSKTEDKPPMNELTNSKYPWRQFGKKTGVQRAYHQRNRKGLREQNPGLEGKDSRRRGRKAQIILPLGETQKKKKGGGRKRKEKKR